MTGHILATRQSDIMRNSLTFIFILVVCMAVLHCTSKKRADDKIINIDNWSGAEFLHDSLEKISRKGLSPFKKGDIDSFRLYLSNAGSKEKERWLYLLYINALYGVDDPEECIELIIKQTLEEESLGLVIKGLSDLNSIVGYGRTSYRNINFTNLIRDRNRFRTILKKQPEAINEMFRLF